MKGGIGTKSYKGWSWEKLFMGILAIMRVLETNLITQTLAVWK